MNKLVVRIFLSISILYFSAGFAPAIHAQVEIFKNIAIQHIEDSAREWGLQNSDVEGILLVDGYTSQKTGVTYLYLQQALQGIPISQAITHVTIDKYNKARTIAHRFIPGAVDKIAPLRNSQIDAVQAIDFASKALKIDISSQLFSINSISTSHQTFRAENMDHEISATKNYVQDDEGYLRLCWNVILDDPQSADLWQASVDAATGQLLQKYNFTVYCKHTPGKFGHSSQKCVVAPPSIRENEEAMAGASYLVFKLPTESPSHGVREMAFDDIYPQASPWGWHDDNGDGVNYTITRGNNVHAYEDKEDKNSSQNVEPDGGTGLSFVFNHDLDLEPIESEEASITNLFYSNNMSHDLFYLLGFTEEAGNFQNRNMGLSGKENDYVQAEGMDGEGLGNANFTTPSDGNRPRMQMYLFNKVPSLLKVESPEALKNLDFEIGTARFGPAPTIVDVEGEIVAFKTINDRDETFACDNVVSNLSGKIAMVDRGICDFSLKAYNTQQAGAIMTIVCNVSGVNGESGEELVDMAAGERADDVTIPAIFMKKSDCDLIKTTIENGEMVTMSLKDRAVEGPSLLDADFDNGIIIHEYAHGVTMRLTGGPSNTNCLPDFDDNGDGFADRGEQMGEGWSDFFGLAFTTRMGDQGFEPRGIGTYVENENPDDNGVRNFPFSTDMDINSLTYDDIKTQSVPHGVGTVWASILWDMYWHFIELYGFDSDWSNSSSGNYRAAFLVMEGLKLQPCRPGFVDGRNAILEADNIHFNGTHQKIIWESFARRGVGMNADQGSSLDQRDGTEDFTIPPLLIEELKIERTASRFVDPGENMNVEIKVTNHIPSIQNSVTISEELPQGLVYVDGSSEVTPDILDNLLVFDIGTMDYQDEITISYQLKADPDIISSTLFLDDVEGGTNGWNTDLRKGSIPWNIVSYKALSGEMSWYIQETDEEEVDQRLITPVLQINGNNPVLRFWHQFNIVSGANGGFVEISTDGGSSWNKVEDHFIIRNQYPGELAFSTFAIPSLKGFSGSTNGRWVDSYIDLNAFKGMNVQLRFRFGNEGVLVSDGDNPGWFIDEIELVDLNVYSSQACVSSEEDPLSRCTDIQYTVVKTASTTSAGNEIVNGSFFKVYPNPASKSLIVQYGDIPEEGFLEMRRMDGNLISKYRLDRNNGMLDLNVEGMPSGFYFIRLVDGRNTYVQKVQVIH